MPNAAYSFVSDVPAGNTISLNVIVVAGDAMPVPLMTGAACAELAAATRHVAARTAARRMELSRIGGTAGASSAVLSRRDVERPTSRVDIGKSGEHGREANRS